MKEFDRELIFLEIISRQFSEYGMHATNTRMKIHTEDMAMTVFGVSSQWGYSKIFKHPYHDVPLARASAYIPYNPSNIPCNENRSSTRFLASSPIFARFAGSFNNVNSA